MTVAHPGPFQLAEKSWMERPRVGYFCFTVFCPIRTVFTTDLTGHFLHSENEIHGIPGNVQKTQKNNI